MGTAPSQSVGKTHSPERRGTHSPGQGWRMLCHLVRKAAPSLRKCCIFPRSGRNPLQQKSGGPRLYRWLGSHFLPRDQGQLCLAGTVQAARSKEGGCPPGAASGTVADHNYLAVLRTAAPSAKWSGTTGFASPGGQRSGNRCPESQRLMDPRQLLGDCHQAAPHCAWKGRAPHRQAGTYITTDGTIFGKCF